MANDAYVNVRPDLHPGAAFLVAGSVPLYLGGLLSDWAYSASAQIQWTNFASWLIAGALVLNGLALLWLVIDVIVGPRVSRRGRLVCGVLLLATWILGFINALVHAKDAWAKMPASLWLSLIVTILAAASAWLALSTSPTSAHR